MNEEPKLNTAELIDSLDNGNFAFVLSEKMKELVRAVKETGKKGSLSLTLTLEPMPKFGDAVAVIPNLKANIPQQTYKQMIRFMTESGMLVGDDPNQRTFQEIETTFGRKAANE